MIFLPYKQFTIRTRFTPDQVRQKLAAEMEKANASLSWNPANKAERDAIEEYKFETHPSSFSKRYRSTIKGKISCEMEITKIEVTMLPQAYVIFFMILTFGFFGFIWFMLLREWISSIGTPYVFFPKHVLGIGGVLILGYAIVIGAVRFEAMEIENSLRSIFGVIEK